MPSRVDLQLEPEQSQEVAGAIRALVETGFRAVDPWWQDGLEEALAPFDRETELPQGDATARLRRTPGAARA